MWRHSRVTVKNEVISSRDDCSQHRDASKVSVYKSTMRHNDLMSDLLSLWQRMNERVLYVHTCIHLVTNGNNRTLFVVGGSGASVPAPWPGQRALVLLVAVAAPAPGRAPAQPDAHHDVGGGLEELAAVVHGSPAASSGPWTVGSPGPPWAAASPAAGAAIIPVRPAAAHPAALTTVAVPLIPSSCRTPMIALTRNVNSLNGKYLATESNYNPISLFLCQGVFTRDEIQPVIEIRTDIILYWRIEFR